CSAGGHVDDGQRTAGIRDRSEGAYGRNTHRRVDLSPVQSGRGAGERFRDDHDWIPPRALDECVLASRASQGLITILPKTARSSTSSCPRLVSLRGRTRSITGLSCPRNTHFITSRKSRWLPMV